MDTWEYKTIRLKAGGLVGGIIDPENFESVLNDAGSQGWELVSCFDTNMSQGQTRFVIAVLKRKR